MNKTLTQFSYIFFILVFFVICTSSLRAENDLKFNHLTVVDGLLHNSATCLAQDSAGFIWIGTQRGLNRYDGYKIDSYLNKTSQYSTLFSNRIRKIKISGDYLWTGTHKGLQCFDLKQKKYITFIEENNKKLVKDKIVYNLFIDSKKRIWMSTPGQLDFALITNNKKDVVLKNVTINNNSFLNLNKEGIPVVVELKNGTLIVSDSAKLILLQSSASKPQDIRIKAEYSIPPSFHVINANGDDLWVFYQNKALAFRIKNGKLNKFDEIDYPDCKIEGVEFNSTNIWLSTNQGLTKVNLASTNNRLDFHMHSIIDPNSVCSDHQSGILIDKSNNLWVSTWSAGLSYTSIAKQKFELVKYMPIKSNKYLPSEFVFSIHEDIKGDIYIGTKFGGISRFNVNSKTFDYSIDLKQKLGVNTLVPCIDSDNDWIYAAVTFQGTSIYRINKISQEIELVKSYDNNTIFSFGFDNHQQLWVGMLGKGLSCLKIENGKVKSEKLFTDKSDPSLNLSSNEVNFVFNDKQKNEVLISTSNGLNRLMLNNNGDVVGVAYYLSDEKNPSTLSSNYVWPIDKENDSIYWVGTLGSGLNRVTIGKRVTGTADYKAERFGVKEGAPSDDIESVLVDKFGNVWCGGRYLSRFNYQTKKFKTYYEEDGLQSYLFGTGTSCKARNGMLFFGGLKGMNYFMPDTTVERKSYQIVFSRLAIDGKMLQVGDTLNGRIVLKNDLQYISKVKLPYPCNNLTIEFTSLNYAQSKNIQYRYKLEGFDKDWIYTTGTNPNAQYSKLPYQNFKFIVEVGVDNQWSQYSNSIEIKILPPWWLSFWAYLIYFLIIVLVILKASKYYLNWSNMKRQILFQNEREKQKEELMELKMNFFTNVSHEFKTPLTLINAAVSEIEAEKEIKSGNNYFELIKRNNSKLLHLIRELMDFQRSNASLIELKTTQMDVCKLLQEIFEEFQPLSQVSGIEFKLTLPPTALYVWVDEEVLVKILSNVISNSLRYTESGGVVEIKLSTGFIENYQSKFNSKIIFTDEMQVGEQLIFSVTDTGVGISSETLPDVFERFHTIISKTSKHLGSGVGLALVKSLVKLHYGGVILSSERNVGTEFVFTIPLKNDYLSENQKTSEIVFDRQVYFDDYKVQIFDKEKLKIDTDIFDESKQTLLIVDDNQEILMVLNEHFKANFNILIAEDGEEALSICNEKYPDIIISDVMMPKMNGLELCNKIKSQFNTCLIPVILLTARGTTEQQIEGIDEGADAYIPKPFDLNLLYSTVTNLLKKYKITNQLSKPSNTNTVDVDLNKRNLALDKDKQLFLDKVTQLINDNISNSSLSVDNLCLEIGVSRSRLYNQMKSITPVTIGEYIREIRFQKAAELLRTTNLSIAEVAFGVGIDSPSFFTRWFKERFGIPPSEYIKQINSSNEASD